MNRWKKRAAGTEAEELTKVENIFLELPYCQTTCSLHVLIIQELPLLD